MKKINLILFGILVSFILVIGVNAQPVNPAFEDDNFYNCLIGIYNYDYDGEYDSTHILTDEELSEIEWIGGYVWWI